MHNAVVLLSGGMDSTTALAQAINDDNFNILALTAGYGSLHQKAETRAAKQVVAWYQRMLVDAPCILEHRIVELDPTIFKGGSSSLLGEADMPKAEYQDIEHEGPSPTVVPFRNANLISVATSIADALGYDRVYVAVHANDHNRWAYPDCSPEFIGAMANAVYVGTMGKVRLITPFIWMTKGDIVTRAAVLGAPLQLTWSCYVGGGKPCGTCPTCQERVAAFNDAGFIDPVDYAVPIMQAGDTWKCVS